MFSRLGRLGLLLAAALLLLVVAAGTVFGQTTTTDYDGDDDGLIDIGSQAQLSAIRHDVNGNGDATHADYIAAFPNRATGAGNWMGCPSGACTGYELTQNLTLTGNWTPIGAVAAADRFATTFDGQGFTISGLTVTDGPAAGLFGYVGSGGIIRNLGVLNPNATNSQLAGAAGSVAGVLFSGSEVNSSWSAGGTVTSSAESALAGGLVGGSSGTIRASYSTNAVTLSGTRNGNDLGGLVGSTNGAIIASYAAGAVSGSGGTGNTYAGFAGRSNTASSTITNSYCDATAAGQTACVGRQTNSSNVTVNSQTASDLQGTSSYTGIYANWNIDTDGVTGGDDPWYFGATYQYPQPHYRAPTTPAVDYDADDDDLIDVGSIAALHAIRHDLNGDGDPATGYDDPYLAGFPGRETGAAGRMGCPNTCAGYELTADLTFPATGALSSWTPIGTYAATLDGNGYAISGMSISHSAGSSAGLISRLAATGVIRNLGVVNAAVAVTSTNSNGHGILVGFIADGGVVSASYVSGGSLTVAASGTRAGPLAGHSRGTITASYATATVAFSGNPAAGNLGGLVGHLEGGSITASYATGAITEGSGATVYHGGLVGRSSDISANTPSITNSYCSAASGETDCIGYQVGSTVTVAASLETASALQTPTDYTGIYSHWNLDLDADKVPDYLWNFRANNEYPILNTPTQRAALIPSAMDYDANDNGLIDISTAAQLNAVRWDANGDGDPDAADANAYSTAFGGRTHTADSMTGLMGCPVADGCTGYELLNNLTLTGNWTPIASFTRTFDGGGHTISGLNVSVTAGHAGLFGTLSTANGVIRNVGLLSPSVSNSATSRGSGALAGQAHANTNIAASYVSGGTVTISGSSSHGGGLVGLNRGRLRATYSTAAVTHSGNPATVDLGGLVGYNWGGEIVASYAAGLVTASTGSNAVAGGLIGTSGGSASAVTNSYCDSTATMQTNCIAASINNSTAAAAAHSTTDLQTPTDYSGIYSHWNLDLDTDKVPDYLWNFGANNAYPILNTPTQRAALIPSAMDYDANDNGLIDISTAAQLNAVRWDANGDGNPDTADANAYSTAFGGRTHTADSMTGLMGCPVADGCTGYELLSSLTLTGSWTPIASFTRTFEGNGYTISGLTVSVSSGAAGLFGALTTANGIIRNLGVISPSVANSSATQNAGGLVGSIGAGANVETSYVAGGSVTVSGATSRAGGLAGTNSGRIRASYATAAVGATGDPLTVSVGGLAGYNAAGEIVASYAAAAITVGSGNSAVGGGLVGTSDGAAAAITDSYCDSTVRIVAGCIGASINNSVAAAAGHSTTDLQTPTAYANTIYANWNLDLDGVTGGDNPWDFGTTSDYPTLRIPSNRPTVAPVVPPPDPVQPGNGNGGGGGNGNGGSGNGQTGGGRAQPVARGGGQPYHPASAHPEIYTNPRHEMSVSCEVRTTGEGAAAVSTSTITFDLGTYTRPITLVLSLWDGQFFRTLQSQNIPMPQLRRDGRMATVEVVTDPAQTRFRIDSEYGLNLVLGYADCRTDDPVE